MAGVLAGLPAGVRVSDYISLGVIAKLHQGGMVSGVAAGEPGCGRHGRERHRFRLSGCQPRRERVSEAALRCLSTGCAGGTFGNSAHDVVHALQPDMLCLIDRQSFGHALWNAGTATGADLLWRVKSNLRLPRATMLADGSYLSVVYPSEKDRRHATNGVQVRVVEYRLQDVADTEPLFRLVTTILDPAQAPAADLAALYHERWDIECALAEL